VGLVRDAIVASGIEITATTLPKNATEMMAAANLVTPGMIDALGALVNAMGGGNMITGGISGNLTATVGYHATDSSMVIVTVAWPGAGSPVGGIPTPAWKEVSVFIGDQGFVDQAKVELENFLSPGNTMNLPFAAYACEEEVAAAAQKILEAELAKITHWNLSVVDVDVEFDGSDYNVLLELNEAKANIDDITIVIDQPIGGNDGIVKAVADAIGDPIELETFEENEIEMAKKATGLANALIGEARDLSNDSALFTGVEALVEYKDGKFVLTVTLENAEEVRDIGVVIPNDVRVAAAIGAIVKLIDDLDDDTLEVVSANNAGAIANATKAFLDIELAKFGVNVTVIPVSGTSYMVIINAGTDSDTITIKVEADSDAAVLEAAFALFEDGVLIDFAVFEEEEDKIDAIEEAVEAILANANLGDVEFSVEYDDGFSLTLEYGAAKDTRTLIVTVDVDPIIAELKDLFKEHGDIVIPYTTIPGEILDFIKEEVEAILETEGYEGVTVEGVREINSTDYEVKLLSGATPIDIVVTIVIGENPDIATVKAVIAAILADGIEIPFDDYPDDYSYYKAIEATLVAQDIANEVEGFYPDGRVLIQYEAGKFVLIVSLRGVNGGPVEVDDVTIGKDPITPEYLNLREAINILYYAAEGVIWIAFGEYTPEEKAEAATEVAEAKIYAFTGVDVEILPYDNETGFRMFVSSGSYGPFYYDVDVEMGVDPDIANAAAIVAEVVKAIGDVISIPEYAHPNNNSRAAAMAMAALSIANKVAGFYPDGEIVVRYAGYGVYEMDVFLRSAEELEITVEFVYSQGPIDPDEETVILARGVIRNPIYIPNAEYDDDYAKAYAAMAAARGYLAAATAYDFDGVIVLITPYGENFRMRISKGDAYVYVTPFFIRVDEVDPPPTIDDILDSKDVEIDTVTGVGKVLTGIEAGSGKNAAALKEMFDIDDLPSGWEFVILNKDEEPIGTGLITTGSIIRILDDEGKTVDQVTVVIMGDVTGTGSTNVGDIIALKNHILSGFGQGPATDALTGAFYQAANLSAPFAQLHVGDLTALLNMALAQAQG
jgi:hypothetical protein